MLDARAVFEQAIGTIPAEKARPVWERWARHQYQYGDLASALAIEKRMAERYPNGSKPSCQVFILSDGLC
jgi:cleavage stimulation factor subunit 3